MPARISEKNLASRSRKRQSEFRRQQLIDATIDCIDRLGMSQTTLARIAERAGLSQGNVVFHFQSKEALLEAALRYLNAEYSDNWRAAIDQAPDDPRAQLRALVQASFAPRVFNRKKISVWFAFWGESRSRPQYMRICGASDRAFSDKMRSLCEAIETRQDARMSAQTAALSIEGTIDGLWQSRLLGSGDMNRAEAIETLFELIDSIFPAPVQTGM